MPLAGVACLVQDEALQQARVPWETGDPARLESCQEHLAGHVQESWQVCVVLACQAHCVGEQVHHIQGPPLLPQVVWRARAGVQAALGGLQVLQGGGGQQHVHLVRQALQRGQQRCGRCGQACQRGQCELVCGQRGQTTVRLIRHTLQHCPDVLPQADDVVEGFHTVQHPDGEAGGLSQHFSSPSQQARRHRLPCLDAV